MTQNLEKCRPDLLTGLDLIAILSSEQNKSSCLPLFDELSRVAREQVLLSARNELSPRKGTVLGTLLRASVRLQAELELGSRARKHGLTMNRYIEKEMTGDDREAGRGGQGEYEDAVRSETGRLTPGNNEPLPFDDLVGTPNHIHDHETELFDDDHFCYQDLQCDEQDLEAIIKAVRPLDTPSQARNVMEKLSSSVFQIMQDVENCKSEVYRAFWALEKRVRTKPRGSRGGRRIKEKKRKALERASKGIRKLSKSQKRRRRN